MSVPLRPAPAAASRQPTLCLQDLLEWDVGEPLEIGGCDAERRRGRGRRARLRRPALRTCATDALCAIALWNSPFAAGVASSVTTLHPPADSPKTVTLSGSPPKPATLSRTHLSAAT